MDSVSEDLSHYPIDTESVEEMDRLTKQAQMITKYVGLYPPEMPFSGNAVILDIACGPGEWVLETARKHPDCQIIGLDLSHRMVAYAQSCARVHRLDNARFEVADVCKELPFSDNSLNVIHVRLVTGFLTTQTWPLFLAECFRVLRPGGVICSTELENMGNTTSPALMRYNSLLIACMRMGQRCFIDTGDQIGILAVQAHLLQKAGFSSISQNAHTLNFSVGMPAHPAMIENYASMMYLMQPALLKCQLIDQENLALLYTKALAEMHANSFCGVQMLQTAWGTKSPL